MSKAETKSKKSASQTFYRYSECFKEKVVQEVSAGSSISAVCRRYDIKNIICWWNASENIVKRLIRGIIFTGMKIV